MPLSLISGNVHWTVETARVDCAETDVAGLFSELKKDSTWPLNFKAKYHYLRCQPDWRFGGWWPGRTNRFPGIFDLALNRTAV